MREGRGEEDERRETGQVRVLEERRKTRGMLKDGRLIRTHGEGRRQEEGEEEVYREGNSREGQRKRGCSRVYKGIQ